MAKFKVNIFFVISIICISLLIGYLWFIFLPVFEGSNEYEAIRYMIGIMTALLLIAALLILISLKVQG